MSLFGSRRGNRSVNRFDELVRPHLERLYRLAYRFTSSREDAEDLVQSLLIKLIPQQAKLEEVDLLGPWLARALYNLFVDDARRLSRQESALGCAISDPLVLEEIIDENAESPEQSAERLLNQRRLSAAWQRLPAEQRAVIAWHDIEGYSLDELSVSHGLPIGTIKSRLHRARARMRELLMEPGGAQKRVVKQLPEEFP
jgi:RNA polymerase sigma-70 factor (ECF subfamily)